MKKKLIIISGPMGVGKTTISKMLLKKLNKSVWLDADWCWMINPFDPNQENREMVHDNITHLLRNFLNNPNFDYIIFNWVMHEEIIFDRVIDPLKDFEFDLFKFSLVCSPEELAKRIQRYPERDNEVQKSLERLPLYNELSATQIDTSGKTPEEVSEMIITSLD